MSPSRAEPGEAEPGEAEPGEADPGSRRCPICSRAAAEKFRPFCSKRCADIDLGRWLGGGYAIPAEEQEPAEDSGGDDEGE